MNKELIINRVAKILKETPSAEEIVKKGGNREQRFKYLANHMVQKGIEKDGLILSEDATGIAILFRTNINDYSFWKDSLEDIKLVLHVTGIKNALSILKKQKYIKAQRPKKGDYLYCWFWGIVKSSRGQDTKIGVDMKDEFLRISERDKLPLYAETQLRKNVIVYQRYGFELFHTWNRPDGKTMWFLRYVPKSLTEKD